MFTVNKKTKTDILSIANDTDRDYRCSHARYNENGTITLVYRNHETFELMEKTFNTTETQALVDLFFNLNNALKHNAEKEPCLNNMQMMS